MGVEIQIWPGGEEPWGIGLESQILAVFLSIIPCSVSSERASRSNRRPVIKNTASNHKVACKYPTRETGIPEQVFPGLEYGKHKVRTEHFIVPGSK